MQSNNLPTKSALKSCTNYFQFINTNSNLTKIKYQLELIHASSTDCQEKLFGIIIRNLQIINLSHLY